MNYLPLKKINIERNYFMNFDFCNLIILLDDDNSIYIRLGYEIDNWLLKLITNRVRNSKNKRKERVWRSKAIIGA